LCFSLFFLACQVVARLLRHCCQGLTAQGATSSTPVLFFSGAHSRFLPHLPVLFLGMEN
jgi:hypothetical protein